MLVIYSNILLFIQFHVQYVCVYIRLKNAFVCDEKRPLSSVSSQLQAKQLQYSQHLTLGLAYCSLAYREEI